MNMIRVRSLSAREGLPQAGVHSSKAASGANNFQDFLANAREVYTKEQLGDMLSSIEEQGKRLAKTMSLGDLKRYKEMLARFLKYCLEAGLELKEEKFFSQNGRQKVLAAVKIVDKKLLELTELVLSQSADAVRILAIVDEIRGLLLDLYA
ncbi:MAG: YaaR family protein [Thermosediminibacteraceae bacterium]|nr:YaaR family protein [Thermosediminibacteraceae bacterium]